MKRFLHMVMCIVFGIMLVVPNFCMTRSTSKTYASGIDLDSNKFDDVIDIIGINCNGVDDKYLFTEGLPYDSVARKFMDGKYITPSQNEYASGSFSYSVSSKRLGSSQSIYVFFFIPDENFNTLKVSVSSLGSDLLTWTFTIAELKIMFSTDLLYGSLVDGWYLLEMPINGSDQNVSGGPSSVQFDKVTISYTKDESKTERSSNYFSIYHMFIANSLKSGKNLAKKYSYFVMEFNMDFIKKLKNLYIGDYVLFSSRTEIFTALYAGKVNLLKSTSLIYDLSIQIKAGSDSNEDIKIGKKYNLKKQGLYNIYFQISGQSISSNIISKEFYVDEYSVGYLKSSYELNKGTNTIVFQMSNDFISDRDVVVETSNNSIATATYYIEDGNLYICVDGKKRGTTDLSVTFFGHRDGKTEQAEYTYETSVVVQKNGQSTYSIILLWSFFGVVCAVFLVFLIILFVKARRFGVK